MKTKTLCGGIVALLVLFGMVGTSAACCVYTPGYWKTHSREGPAPYDPAWGGLALRNMYDEEDSKFVGTDMTWYQMFWTQPKGNAYFILAHAWGAARLNVLHGSGMPLEVQEAQEKAHYLLDIYGSAMDIPKKVKGTANPDREEAIRLAGILDAWNNGLMNEPHCE